MRLALLSTTLSSAVQYKIFVLDEWETFNNKLKSLK